MSASDGTGLKGGASPAAERSADGIAEARFRASNRRYAQIATVVIAGILLLMSIYVFIVTYSLVTGTAMPLGWIVNWVPALFYGWAVWRLRSLFIALSQDSSVASTTVAIVVARVGWALMFGAVATLIPLANFFSNQPTRGGGLVAYLVPAATLFLVGLALTWLAPMLNRAVALELKAQALKAELEEFF